MTQVLPPLIGVRITGAEYDALPPNPRIELVDGVLTFMTPPTGRHQNLVDALVAALKQVCPAELRVLREQEIRLSDDHRRNPDVLVVLAEAYDPDGYSYRPEQVLLAVEVVSPGTETADRKHKPAEYADAGVAHYWRVESKPALAVYTYQRVDEGPYVPTGRWVPGDLVAAPGLPWAHVAVAELASS
ncbi:Uma2 family endonuclease [Catellatospora sp. NPDC049609]|uniref:Uma2 family endonuclease n=1 Tax=Catellatospora sp. NPDC049609 TaxID=3155505 RepID=UPI00343C9820